jgi:hypothetical protein
LGNKIKLLGYQGSRKPRSLWLPTVIENADTISVVTYPSMSVRKLTPHQAINFVKKYDIKLKIMNDVFYKASIPTGFDYCLHVEYLGETILYPFTEWVVCICENNKLPDLVKRVKDKSAESITSKIPKITPYDKDSSKKS